MYDRDLLEINKILKEYISLHSTLSSKKDVTGRWQRVKPFDKKLIYIFFSCNLLFSFLFIYVKFVELIVCDISKISDIPIKNNTSLQADFSWYLCRVLSAILSWIPDMMSLVAYIIAITIFLFISSYILRSIRILSQISFETLESITEKANIDLVFVEELSRFPNKLKYFQKQVGLEIKEQELRNKISSNIAPIIALLYVVLGIIIFGKTAQSIPSNLFFGTISGAVGLVGITAIFVNLIIELDKRRITRPLLKLSSLLERAQEFANEPNK